MFIEEFGAGMIRADPILMAQKVMYLVRINQLLEVDTIRAQSSNEIHRLRKLDVAIVVAVNQQHRRFPFVHRRDWRRLARESRSIWRFDRQRQARDALTPVMHAVKINSSSEDVRVARQAQRRQVTSVRSPPQPDALFVNVVALTQILRASDDILILRRAARAAMLRQPKAATVADAAAIIHRKNRVAATRQILIHRVRVVIVIKVMP